MRRSPRQWSAVLSLLVALGAVAIPASAEVAEISIAPTGTLVGSAAQVPVTITYTDVGHFGDFYGFFEIHISQIVKNKVVHATWYMNIGDFTPGVEVDYDNLIATFSWNQPVAPWEIGFKPGPANVTIYTAIFSDAFSEKRVSQKVHLSWK